MEQRNWPAALGKEIWGEVDDICDDAKTPTTICYELCLLVRIPGLSIDRLTTHLGVHDAAMLQLSNGLSRNIRLRHCRLLLHRFQDVGSGYDV